MHASGGGTCERSWNIFHSFGDRSQICVMQEEEIGPELLNRTFFRVGTTSCRQETPLEHASKVESMHGRFMERDQACAHRVGLDRLGISSRGGNMSMCVVGPETASPQLPTRVFPTPCASGRSVQQANRCG